MPFLPLLMCLKTHCVPFSGQSAPDCRILQSRKFFRGPYARTLADPLPVLGPRHQFPLGSPAFPLFLFCETTAAVYPVEIIPKMTRYVSHGGSLNLIHLFWIIIKAVFVSKMMPAKKLPVVSDRFTLTNSIN